MANPIAEELSRRAAKHTIPLDVTWEITKRCNLDCLPCYVSKDSHDELSLQEGLRLIRDLAGEKTMYLSFTGGEPFLRPAELRQWAFAARENGMTITFFTNGTRVGKDEISWLTELSPFAVHISLFAVTAEIHDRITTVCGSFDKALQTIRSCRDAGITVVIKTLIQKANFDQRQKMITLAQRLGVSWSIDPVVTPTESGGKRPLDNRITDRQVDRLFSDTAEHFVDRFYPSTPEEFLCGAGTTLAAVSAAGEVYPCLMYPHSAGNIRTDSFGGIWKKSPFLHRLRRLQTKDIPSCRECADLTFCSRCPGLAMLEDGDEYGPSKSSCMLARVTKKVVKKHETGKM